MSAKECSGCDRIKLYAEFYPRSRQGKYKDSDAGYSHLCKICTAVDKKAYREANLEKVKEIDINSRLKRTYGIDLNQYNQMFAEQEGCCKGCEKHQSELKFRLAVDHRHSDGQIRGLLCQTCNRAIGMLQENVKTLNNLITYLSPELAAKSNVLPFKAVTKVG